MFLFMSNQAEKSENMRMGLFTRDLGSASDADRGRDLDSKTTLPPHGLDPDPSCMLLCCVTVRKIQSSSVMRVVCVRFGAHARPSWIRIGDPHPVNPFSVPVWRAPWSVTCQTIPAFLLHLRTRYNLPQILWRERQGGDLIGMVKKSRSPAKFKVIAQVHPRAPQGHSQGHIWKSF